MEKENHILRVGITGGIGTGKTTVCKIFEQLGIPIYYADERARFLMNHDAQLKEQIKALFGQDAYLPDGTLNRQLLAQIAFSDPLILTKLNNLVHPAVQKDTFEWQTAQTLGLQIPAYTLREAALLFESGSDKHLDKIIVVTSPLDVRIARVIARDKTTKEAILARMEKQMPEEDKIKKANFIIHNDGKQSLIQQVLEIHHQLLLV